MLYTVSRSSEGYGVPHKKAELQVIYDFATKRSTERWTIVIPDLIQFVKENGKCVISCDGSVPHIEIYDWYRE